MGSPSTGISPPAQNGGDDRLDSWKEIAAYLKRDVTTVQRWEKRESMPIHRHLHDKMGSVYAFRSELDAWARGRSAQGSRDRAHSDGRVDVPEESGTGSPAPRKPSLAVRPSRRAAAVILLAAVIVAAAAFWFRHTGDDWSQSILNSRFQRLTDFEGTEQEAAISRDGRLVAFVSDRDGQMDVWITQVGTGQSHNLTQGRVTGIGNPSLRELGFSPDGALITFWARTPTPLGSGDINVWAVPALGGAPRPYLEGIAEFDWSNDQSRLVYHTPGPGDPTFIRESNGFGQDRAIFKAADGFHAHFPLWSPDQQFIYFVQGRVDAAMDIWRIRAAGGEAERMTRHDSRVSHPVVVDRSTLMYLASDKEGGGPWLHILDMVSGVSRRVSSGLERYTSLAASADGRRLALTLSNPKGTLWRVPLDDASAVRTSAPSPVSLTTRRGFFPRIGPGYLLYVSSNGARDAIWKLAGGTSTELWSAPDGHIIGSPDIEPHGQRIAFSAERAGRTTLYVMNADGTDVRVVTSALALRGTPAWAPDGGSIVSGADVNGTPRLFTVSLDGTATPLVEEYSVDPVWAPTGRFVAYSGADIGTTFRVRAAAFTGPYPLPDLTLTRGARRLRFIRGGGALVVMRGDIQHKDLWSIDLATGTERQLTNLPADFEIRDFDVSPDGREIVIERVQEDSDVVLLDLRQ